MKKLLSLPIIILMMAITFSHTSVQSQNSVKTVSLSSVTAPEPSVQFSISIPSRYADQIVRENADNTVFFYFKKSDGTNVFLFQVSRIDENQWVKIKEQLVQPTILAHKDGLVYYALATDRSKIKGEDGENYAKVYAQINQLINSIVITE